MPPEKRLILRGGPYAPPDSRPGEVLVCRVAGSQVVEGFSAAPIPWPYFSAPKGGGPRLFVCGDLARALAQEPGRVVGDLFGCSETVACRWRRELRIPPVARRSGVRKLSDDQVDELRIRAAAGEERQALAVEFGISGAYAWMLISRPGENRPRPAG
jgi:hypothetical protein